MTAAVALPLLIFFILKADQRLFAAFIGLLSLLGLQEFFRMSLPNRSAENLPAALVGGLFTICFLPAFQPLVLPVGVGLVILSCLVALFRIGEIRAAVGDVALRLFGFLYVPLLLGQMILLRNEPHGVAWIFLLLVIVMCGDTGAYYVGSTLGRRKLYPVVSPNKSVEGSIGGLAGSLVGALIASRTFFPELTIVDCCGTALLLGPMGQLGDLFESLLKRSCGVKDSGTIIPGHGGILDRLDSILFAAPAAWWYAHYLF